NVDWQLLRSRVGSASDAVRSDLSQDLPFSASAKNALEIALGEAKSLNHPYVGTEHLLLGLLRTIDIAASGVLDDAHVTADAARAEVLRLVDGLPGRRESLRWALGPGRLTFAIALVALATAIVALVVALRG